MANRIFVSILGLALLQTPSFVHGQKVQYPLGIAVSNNRVFISDKDTPAIWQVADSKASVHVKASRKFRTPLNAVRYLSTDAKGQLLAGDSATRNVYRIAKGKPTPLTKGSIGNPMGIGVNKKGDIIVANIELHEIVRIPAAGGAPVRIARVVAPRGLHIDSKDNIWVVSNGRNAITKITPDGKATVALKGRAFGFPHDITMDKTEKTLFITDGYGKCVWKFTPGGKPEKFATGKPLVNPTCMAWRGANLLLVDSRARAVFSIDAKGKIATVFQQK